MPLNHTIAYVTGNLGKYEEVKTFIHHNCPQIQIDHIIIELDEMQTLDQKAIAISKAKQAYAQVKRPLLIDDSAVYFDKYHRFPGTLTKFVYHGIGFEGILKLVEDDHRATCLLYLIYIDGDDSYTIFEGKSHGKIVSPSQFIAHADLPYDDIFLPDGASKTYAQMRGTKEIEKYAHRLKAVKKFLVWFGEKCG